MRKEPEDFVVEEIPLNLGRLKKSSKRDNVHTLIVITARNWETNRLLDAISSKAGISRHRLSFAGTKDKRAITTQSICVKGTLGQEAVDRIEELKDVEVQDRYYSSRQLNMGDHRGNRFLIDIKDAALKGKELKRAAEECISELDEIRGFPNYFGIQRFGIRRPITHLVGKHMINGDFEQAVMTYVANPFEQEGDEVRKARERIGVERDYEQAMKYYPKHLYFERKMIKGLAKNTDYIQAMKKLPNNLLLMFVHAYQSYLFNKILSKRMESGIGLDRVTVGDIAIGLDGYGRPNANDTHLVKEFNRTRVEKLVERGRAFITGLVPGLDVPRSRGDMGNIEERELEAESLIRKDFIINEIPRLTTHGRRRGIVAPVRDLNIETGEQNIKLKFGLGPGTYATTLLREFMKSDCPTSY